MSSKSLLRKRKSDSRATFDTVIEQTRLPACPCCKYECIGPIWSSRSCIVCLSFSSACSYSPFRSSTCHTYVSQLHSLPVVSESNIKCREFDSDQTYQRKSKEGIGCSNAIRFPQIAFERSNDLVRICSASLSSPKRREDQAHKGANTGGQHVTSGTKKVSRFHPETTFCMMERRF